MTTASHIAIKGDLTIAHIAKAMARAAKMPKQSAIVVDLAGMKDADSSAVAFLLNCIRIGKERGSTVKFASVPASVLTLADIYGLKAVIADATLAA